MLACALAFSLASSAIGSDRLHIGGHVPHNQMSRSHHLGRLASRASLDLAFVLKPRDPAGLADLAKRVYDPNDPQYGRFLSSAEFKDRFAPTDKDVNDVLDYLRAKGFRRVHVHANNLVIDASADSQTIEGAFNVQMHEYLTRDGRRVHAPLTDPDMSEDIAARLHTIAGLSSFRHSRPRLAQRGAALDAQNPDSANGINSYMTPSKIKSAYGFSTSASAGQGETVALFELDGFTSSDLTTYETQFGIAAPSVNTILVDGVSGAAGSDSNEVTLDIELVMAVAPAAAIQVYEGPNTDNGVLDTYNRIASDNTAKLVSTSWGASEDGDTQAYLDAENSIFQQMAVQGQSVFAAAGDSGAYDDPENPNLLTVDDPASQPWVTAVGGTTLSTLNGNYGGETSWGNSATGIGGGGGVSAVWAIPSWQSGLASIANRGSNTRRMTPDVALDANPNTGYSIYFGGWYAYGGTSASAPLWAAFMATVNQARVNASLSRIGFANPSLYQVAQSSLYSSCFHDISDGSTNLYFPTTAKYDLATGLGTPRGSALLAALSGALPPAAPANVSTSSSGTNVIINWDAVSGATSYTVYRSTTFSGTYLGINTANATTYSDPSGTTGFYYYVTANNAAGSSGPSAKRAGAAPLASPGAASGLSGGGTP